MQLHIQGKKFYFSFNSFFSEFENNFIFFYKHLEVLGASSSD